jgi:peptidoglycan/LPS O-acetylase OafA/YrhL
VSETVIDPRFTNRERQPGLDLLRSLAIIVVVIYLTGIFGFGLPHGFDCAWAGH